MPAVLSAQVTLVTWNFDGATPGSQATISATSLVASADNVSVGGTASASRLSSQTVTNIGPASASGSIAAYALGTANATIGNASGFGTTPNAANYVSFRFTLGSSLSDGPYNLGSISFDLSNAGNTVRGVEVTYRVGTSGAFVSLGSTDAPTLTANNFGRFTFTPTGSVALTASDVVEFRFLGYAASTGASIRYDNVSVSAVAVPEPSAFAALAGMGALGFAALRRRRRG